MRRTKKGLTVIKNIAANTERIEHIMKGNEVLGAALVLIHCDKNNLKNNLQIIADDSNLSANSIKVAIKDISFLI